MLAGTESATFNETVDLKMLSTMRFNSKKWLNPVVIKLTQRDDPFFKTGATPKFYFLVFAYSHYLLGAEFASANGAANGAIADTPLVFLILFGFFVGLGLKIGWYFGKRLLDVIICRFDKPTNYTAYQNCKKVFFICENRLKNRNNVGESEHA